MTNVESIVTLSTRSIRRSLLLPDFKMISKYQSNNFLRDPLLNLPGSPSVFKTLAVALLLILGGLMTVDATEGPGRFRYLRSLSTRVKDAGLRRTGQSQLMRKFYPPQQHRCSREPKICCQPLKYTSILIPSQCFFFSFPRFLLSADVKKIDAEEVDAEEVAAQKGHAWGDPACMKEELKKFPKSGKVFEGIGSVSEVGKLSSTHRINQIVALEEECFTKRGKGKRKGQHFRDQLLLIYLMTEKPLLHESQENLAEVVDVALQCLASLCKRFNDENYTGLHLATSTVWDRIYDEHKNLLVTQSGKAIIHPDGKTVTQGLSPQSQYYPVQPFRMTAADYETVTDFR
ncbi:hypothetical protein MJO28_016719 [Puccinia striiformis f. sp. tritici]|uniref:Uncharacterized protein n=1 Tax=Puccinia striiformis f. sp. tritici TaxID=168172 RepID=A0ACC0DRI4_9BASI|nr:hypothetical protein MJO28_016719 [Puccinia striiformis f. sp. tritici]